MSKPLVIDLYCGLGGWAEGFLAEDYDVIGFDIEQRPYPGQLVLQDTLTLHGSQFKHAAAIVASPPCQEYSYMAMPWKRGKQIAAALREKVDFPEGCEGSRTIEALNALFDACFRIQREASEAAGREIPMVVENVKGAQPWVGRARAHFGSFYLWGDINSVGNSIVAGNLQFGNVLRPAKRGRKLPGNNSPRMWTDREVQRLCDAPVGDDGRKNDGGSWFNIANNTESGTGQNPDGRKVPMNFREHEKTGKPGRSFQSVAVEEGKKGFTTGLGKGHDWRQDPSGRFNSKSSARKAASAAIAKIPFPLANHIARVFKP